MRTDELFELIKTKLFNIKVEVSHKDYNILLLLAALVSHKNDNIEAVLNDFLIAYQQGKFNTLLDMYR